MNVVSTHDAGFFSCCSVKLDDIVDFINTKHIVPSVDGSSQFSMYKFNHGDITYDYFEKYNNIQNIIKYPIDYKENYQFMDYSLLEYNTILPIVKKYYTPSKHVMNTVEYLKNKYEINEHNEDFEPFESGQYEYIAVYYRATDKIEETQIASFEEFYNKIIEINKDNLKIIIQTDSSQFLDYIKSKLNNLIIILENDTTSSDKGVHFLNGPKKNYQDMFYLFSTFLILSKCKYIITGSSNASMWMMFYRGNNHNVHQYLNGQWLNNKPNTNHGLYIAKTDHKTEHKRDFSKFFFNQ